MNFETWNILNLYRSGVVKQLQMQMDRYKLDISAVQEVRWKESSIVDMGGYIFLNSASTKRNIHGIGFVVRKCLAGNITDFRSVDERISIVRLRGKFFNKSLMSAHAPN